MATATQAATAVPISRFKRRPPPFPMRCALGLWMYGVGAPAMWGLQKIGRAERVFARMAARRERRLIEQNPFSGYTPGKQDVFVATYAKSGTNWMMQIAHQLLWHGKGEFDHIHSVVPWPDAKLVPPFRHYAIPLDDDSVWRAAPEHKRVIKTHFDWELIPYSPEARYIVVIRDAKDVFVSNYHFFKDTVFGPAMPSVETWFRLYLSPNFPMGGSWAANAAGYWAERKRANVLVVSFREMKRDLDGIVRRVADFLDVRVPESVLATVRDQSSFSYMKRIDDKFGVWRMIPWGPQSSMIRKGAQGGSSEMLSTAQQRETDAYFIAELKRLGSDLPYEEFCDVTR